MCGWCAAIPPFTLGFSRLRPVVVVLPLGARTVWRSMYGLSIIDPHSGGVEIVLSEAR